MGPNGPLGTELSRALGKCGGKGRVMLVEGYKGTEYFGPVASPCPFLGPVPIVELARIGELRCHHIVIVIIVVIDVDVMSTLVLS